MNTADAKLTATEDIFAKIFAMTDCKVVSESYIAPYGSKIKDEIWKCFSFYKIINRKFSQDTNGVLKTNSHYSV